MSAVSEEVLGGGPLAGLLALKWTRAVIDSESPPLLLLLSCAQFGALSNGTQPSAVGMRKIKAVVVRLERVDALSTTRQQGPINVSLSGAAAAVAVECLSSLLSTACDLSLCVKR